MGTTLSDASRTLQKEIHTILEDFTILSWSRQAPRANTFPDGGLIHLSQSGKYERVRRGAGGGGGGWEWRERKTKANNKIDYRNKRKET